MKTIASLLLVPLTALAQPPIPQVPLITQDAYAIIVTSKDTNSEAYRLSDAYLNRMIEPTYYGYAISNIYSSSQLAMIVSNANHKVPMAKVLALTSGPLPTTNGLAYSNQPTALCLGSGRGQLNSNNYLPAYNLQAAGSLLVAQPGNMPPKPAAFTNLQVFPAGSPGFTNNASSTNPQQFYRVRYAQ